MKRVLLVNDTYAWYHWGCTATSLGLSTTIASLGCTLDYLKIDDIYRFSLLPKTLADFDNGQFLKQVAQAHPLIFQQLQQADVIVINGEGTLHGLSKPVIVLLYLAYIARVYLKKPVHIINHSAYPREATDIQVYRYVYERMDFIAVREQTSYQWLKQHGITPHVLSFDCLPLGLAACQLAKNVEALPRPRVLITNGVNLTEAFIPAITQLIQKLQHTGYEVCLLSGAKAYLATDLKRFIEWMNEACKDAPLTLLNPTSLTDWFRAVQQASCLISGRFHHSIAAYFLDTPFVLMESNTPKVKALCNVLQQPSPILYSQSNFKELLWQRTDEVLSNNAPNEAAAEIKNVLRQRALLNFSGLRNQYDLHATVADAQLT